MSKDLRRFARKSSGLSCGRHKITFAGPCAVHIADTCLRHLSVIVSTVLKGCFIAPTQCISSGLSLVSTTLSAADLDHFAVVADVKIHALWSKVLRQDRARAHNAHLSQNQYPLKCRCILIQQRMIAFRTTGVFHRRRKTRPDWSLHRLFRCRGAGCKGQKDDEFFHAQRLRDFASL